MSQYSWCGLYHKCCIVSFQDGGQSKTESDSAECSSKSATPKNQPRTKNGTPRTNSEQMSSTNVSRQRRNQQMQSSITFGDETTPKRPVKDARREAQKPQRSTITESTESHVVAVKTKTHVVAAKSHAQKCSNAKTEQIEEKRNSSTLLEENKETRSRFDVMMKQETSQKSGNDKVVFVVGSC